MNKLLVDIWSDIACPWCYIGKRRLEAALARFPERAAVEVIWHAFELDPSAVKASPQPGVSPPSSGYAQRLAKKYGLGVPEAERRIAQVKDLAAAEGLSFHFDRVRPTNSFDAHRVLHLARARGPGLQNALQNALQERLFRAYFTDGEVISDPEVLVRLAGEVMGAEITGEEIRALLATDAYAAEVRDDERQAARIGIRGVPFFVLDNKYGVSGAQLTEVLLAALGQAWEERTTVDTAGDAAGPNEAPVCGPDGCP